MFPLSLTHESTRRAALLACVTILCVIVAPVCAPLCAAKLCAAASHNQCHGMTPDEYGQSILSAKSACRAFDFSAVLPRVDGQLTASATNRSLSLAYAPALSGPTLAIAFRASRRKGTLHSPLRLPGNSPQTIVLRV